ncbi:MAG: biotin--[acetyl-CoA-carboxylase] ligase [Novosphingobium sp.]|nr:biotin--[acetyl-CoA-carboxylase] ligase [Novosphingobium sp.]
METVRQTGSTNADLLARFKSGEPIPEGYWLVADRQESGRGRMGRVWAGGAGNFMGSTLIRLNQGDPPPATLSFVAGIAVHEAVAPLLDRPDLLVLKWPNDLLLGGAKLAGILLEAWQGGVVAGIGVNLASAPAIEGQETIALGEIGIAPDRDAFAMQLAARFESGLARWRNYGKAALLSRWLQLAHAEGTPMTVHEPGGAVVQGKFAGLDADGALKLRLADGTIRLVHAGDVST